VTQDHYLHQAANVQAWRRCIESNVCHDLGRRHELVKLLDVRALVEVTAFQHRLHERGGSIMGGKLGVGRSGRRKGSGESRWVDSASASRCTQAREHCDSMTI
jgi:hypothetical protein